MALASTPRLGAGRGLTGLGFALGARALGVWRRRPHYGPAPAGPTIEGPLGRLEQALELGALESAQELLPALRAELDAMRRNAPFRARASIAAIDTLLMLGEVAEARELAVRDRLLLERTAQGCGRLESLGEACPLRAADGGWNFLGASRQLASGALDAQQLTSLVGGTFWPCLAKPELALLFFSTLWSSEPQRALDFLGAFLTTQGLACRFRIDAVGAELEALARLRSSAPRRPARGPLVSVIVPAYQAASTLAYALESLLVQTHGAIEILVGDDASKDGTLEVMRRFADEPRVRLFRSLENQGAYNLRNQLAAQARGDWLTFHDADDWALPSRIASQLATLRSTKARAVVTGLLRLTPHGHVVFGKNQRATRLSRVSLMLRRESFLALDGFRSVRVGGDYELAAKLTATWGGRALARIKPPLMLCRSSSDSAIGSADTEARADGYRSPVRRAYCQLVFHRYVQAAPLTDEAIDERLRDFGNWQTPSDLLELRR